MRKPIAALAVAFLGLGIGQGLLAGDDGSNPRASLRRGTPAARAKLVATRQAIGERSGWLLQFSYVLEVVAIQPSYGTLGIIDEPDPTSSRDRSRRRGGGSSGGGGQTDDSSDDSPSNSSGFDGAISQKE